MVNPSNPTWLTRQFRQSELGKNYLLTSGKMNPWELPEFSAFRNTLNKERDLGLSDYARKLMQTGVEGPGAALGLERYNNQYSNRLLELVNKIKTGTGDKGLTIGNSILDQQNKDRQAALTWQGQHDQRQAQPNDFMKTLAAIKGSIGVLGDVADLGFGAAGFMGALPGQQGVSSLATNAQGSIIEQLLKKLLQGGLT